ncbi:MAG: NfeD family protein [Gammaproteobacteria bacterium]|nr:NfeD family protein [Gammaproteobacteria bacterium]
MVEYFNANQHTFWFVLGFALLALEGLVLGMTTGVVLFSSIGALVTGGLLAFGLIPVNWIAGIAAFAISSVLVTAVLWKPLKRMQSEDVVTDTKSSDLIGHSFRLSSDITRDRHGTTRYSGIEWRVELDETSHEDNLPSGERVEVSGVDAGLFRVKRVLN